MKNALWFACLVFLSNCTSSPAQKSVESPPPIQVADTHYYTPRHGDGEFYTPERLTEFRNLRIYEVMVESFMDGDPQSNMDQGYGTSHHRGDIRGITQSLDYIKDLGYNALWVTPVFFVGGNTKLDATGYFPQDYFKIEPRFGTLEDARELVIQAHNRGLYVFFDAVFGHNKLGLHPSPSGILPEIKTKGSQGSTVFFDQGKVYQNSVDFFIEVATYWIQELEIDGWRLDVAYELKQGRHIFWQEIREAVQDLCLERTGEGKSWGTLGFMVAETWKSAGEITTLTFGRESNKGVFCAFDFPLRYELMNTLATGEGNNSPERLGDARHLSEAFNSHALAPQWGFYALMLGNHDLVRFGDLIQRSQGLRYGPENPDYWKRHQLAFAFQAAYTGPIMNYYGEEIGEQLGAYAGGEDFSDKVPHTAATPSAQWGVADDHVARTSGRIEGLNTTLTPREKELKNYLRHLLAMRASHPALYDGVRIPLTVEGSLYADLKVKGDGKILFLANLGTESIDFSLAVEGASAQPLGPDKFNAELDHGNIRGTLPGLSAEFYLIK